MNNFNKPHLITLFFCIAILSSGYAQVGIGNVSPSNDALLEIGNATTTTKGLLLPRVNLLATTNPSPLSTDVLGMIVYNKNTAGDVTPGFYYNDGVVWVRIGAGAVSDDWTTTGNAGTNPATNYIGTNDNQDVVIRANNVERVRVGTTETVINENSNDYDYRIESNNQTNMFFVDAGNNRIGIQTGSPAHVLHVSNNGIDIGATPLALVENTGSDGVALSGSNDGTSNGYNAIEGATSGAYSGVFGLGVSQDNGGSYDAYGVYGHANDLQGVGVYGVRASTGGGPDSGFGGLFSNDLGYTGGLYNVSDKR